jgi:hypothetical protein
MSSQDQSEYEKKWAQALLNYINVQMKGDYVLVHHDNNETPCWADVDVGAVSPSKKFPPLYLQLTSDSRLSEIIKHGIHRIPVFHSNNILRAISEKQDKYLKSGKDFSQITLVIQGTMSKSSIPFEFTDSLHKICSKFLFKEIYYLSAPALVGSKTVKHFEDWLVIKIKQNDGQ